MQRIQPFLAWSLALAAALCPGCSSSSGTSGSQGGTAVPAAAFTFTPASPTANQVVTFTDASTHTPTAWAWNFGDGATSAAQSPSHAYAAAGSYTVTLTASNSAGSGAAASQELTVAAGQLQSINQRLGGLDNGVVVAIMTYAGDIFSWWAGDLDADVYFCPERHGTYYGGFYVKDGPAVGVPGYQISTTLTADAGNDMIDSSQGYVTSAQAAVLSALAAAQQDNLYAGTPNIVQIRTEIATLLRSLRESTANSDAVRARVLALSAVYGDLDGQDNCCYINAFAQAYGTMDAAQLAKLATLRASFLTGTYQDGSPFDFTTCTTYYLYSGAISDTSRLYPYIADTDPLFFEP